MWKKLIQVDQHNAFQCEISIAPEFQDGEPEPSYKWFQHEYLEELVALLKQVGLQHMMLEKEHRTWYAQNRGLNSVVGKKIALSCHFQYVNHSFGTAVVPSCGEKWQHVPEPSCSEDFRNYGGYFNKCRISRYRIVAVASPIEPSPCLDTNQDVVQNKESEVANVSNEEQGTSDYFKGHSAESDHQDSEELVKLRKIVLEGRTKAMAKRRHRKCSVSSSTVACESNRAAIVQSVMHQLALPKSLEESQQESAGTSDGDQASSSDMPTSEDAIDSSPSRHFTDDDIEENSEIPKSEISHKDEMPYEIGGNLKNRTDSTTTDEDTTWENVVLPKKPHCERWHHRTESNSTEINTVRAPLSQESCPDESGRSFSRPSDCPTSCVTLSKNSSAVAESDYVASEISSQESDMAESETHTYNFRDRRSKQHFYGPFPKILNFESVLSSQKRDRRNNSTLRRKKRSQGKQVLKRGARSGQTGSVDQNEEILADCVNQTILEDDDRSQNTSFDVARTPAKLQSLPVQKSKLSKRLPGRPRLKRKYLTDWSPKDSVVHVSSASDLDDRESAEKSPTWPLRTFHHQNGIAEKEKREGIRSSSNDSSDSTVLNGSVVTVDSADTADRNTAASDNPVKPLSKAARILMRLRMSLSSGAPCENLPCLKEDESPGPKKGLKRSTKLSRKHKGNKSSQTTRCQTHRHQRSRQPSFEENDGILRLSSSDGRLFGHIDPAQYEIEPEIAEKEIAEAKYIRFLKERHLKYIFDQNLSYLKDIFEGKEFCRRHNDFMHGGVANKNLTYQVFMNLFSESQLDFVMELLVSVFCKKSNKYMDYVLKVLFPETLIGIHVKKKGTCREESEQQMLSAAYTAAEDNSEVEP